MKMSLRRFVLFCSVCTFFVYMPLYFLFFLFYLIGLLQTARLFFLISLVKQKSYLYVTSVFDITKRDATVCRLKYYKTNRVYFVFKSA